MFEFIRTHKRLMQFLLLLLIFPSFVLVGVSSYQQSSGGNAVADVAGVPIMQEEWDAAQRAQIERYRQMFGAQFDQKMFDTPEAKQRVLEELVSERALAAEMGRNRLTVSDATLMDMLFAIPDLQKPDHSFDYEKYRGLLAAQGMTPEAYEARTKRDMALGQVRGAIEGSAFAPRAVTNRLSDINEQEREVQELMFPNTDFVAQVNVTDDMVKAFYDKNAAQFQIPEQVKIEYTVLDVAAVDSQVVVSDAEVAASYTQNQKRYTSEERRRASHILITVKKDSSTADKAAARAKAEALLAQVRKTPVDFAQIAKTQSQDPASAESGGDLDVIEKGSLPKPVEDAIYKMKQGEISDVVASDYGFHVITVTSVTAASVKTIEEVRADIVADLRKQKASKKYSELAEAFANTVYEQSDSLKPVADKLKLKIETVSNLARTPSPMLGTAAFNNAKFLKAVFSDETLKNKRNTDAVEVAPNTLIAGRVVEFKPATRRPLAEVDAQIRQRVTLEQAAKLARKAGEAKFAAVKASGDAAGFGEAKSVSRTKQPAINSAAALEVLKADVSKLPAYVGVDVPGQGYGLYRIAKVGQPAQPDAARRQTEQQQIANAMAQQESFAYVEALKKKAKATIHKPAALVADDAALAPQPK